MRPFLIKAIHIAAEAHAADTDKSGLPYIFHPLTVMMNPSLATDEERAVAVLHDVVEDTDWTCESLGREGIPAAVVDAVQAITKEKGEGYHDYLARVKANPLALTVKLADIEHNTSPARLEKLRESERQYLEGKYAKALAFLRPAAA